MESLKPNVVRVVEKQYTWVGRCGLCNRFRLMALDPAKDLSTPCEAEWFTLAVHDEVQWQVCTGIAILPYDWKALLAAYYIGGLEALSGI